MNTKQKKKFKIHHHRGVRSEKTYTNFTENFEKLKIKKEKLIDASLQASIMRHQICVCR